MSFLDIPIWSAIGWTMLHFLWVGTILGVLAAVGKWLLHKTRLEVQYVYSLACLMAMAVTPAIIATQTLFPINTTELPDTTVPIDRVLISEPVSQATVPAWPDEVRTPNPVPRITPPALQKSASWHDFGSLVLERAVRYLPLAWMIGAPLTFAYLALGYAGAEHLRRHGLIPLNAELQQQASRLAGVLGITRRVELLTSDKLVSPVLVGIIRPTILLPAAALAGWSPAELEMVLIHELMHVKRWDNLVLLVQRLITAALFFHPVVWIVSRWVSRERELCCDAAVVQRTGKPRDYAELLMKLAPVRPALAQAALAMAEGNLVVRVRHLLMQEDASMKMKLPRLTLGLALSLVCLPALWLVATGMASSASQETEDKKPAQAQLQPEEIQRIANEVKQAIARDEPSYPQELTQIARAQAKLGDRTAALETLAQATRLAREFKQSIVQNGNNISSGPSSANLLEDIARAQLELDDKPGALETLKLTIQALTPEQSPESFSRLFTMLNATKMLVRLGQIDEARKFVQLLDEEAKAPPRSPAPGIPPMSNPLAVPMQAAGHLAIGDTERAFGILDEISKKADPALDQFWSFFGPMAETAVLLDKETANKALDFLAQKLDQVPATGYAVVSLSSMAESFAKIGKIDRAKQIAHRAKNSSFLLSALQGIAREQLQQNDKAGAIETLEEAHEVYKKSAKEIDIPSSLNSIAQAMIQAGHFDAARACSQDLPAGERHQILEQLAIALRDAGKGKDAADLFQAALRDLDIAMEQDRPTWPKGLLLGTPPDLDERKAQRIWAQARIEAQSGQYAKAQQTASGISHPKAFHRSWACGSVASIMAAQGHAAEALAWMKELQLPPDHDKPMVAILQGMADYAEKQAKPADHKLQDTNQAPETPNGIQGAVEQISKGISGSVTGNDPATLINLARIQGRAGDRGSARKTLAQATRMAQELKQTIVQEGNLVHIGATSGSRLAEIAEAQIEMNDKPGALETLKLTPRYLTPEYQPHEFSRVSTMLWVIKLFVQLGQTDQARNVVELIDKEGKTPPRAPAPELFDSPHALTAPTQAAAHLAIGDAQGAFEIMDRKAESPDPYIQQRSSFIRLMAEAAPVLDQEAAGNALEQLAAKFKAFGDIGLEAPTLTSLSNGFAKIGKPDRAKQIARMITIPSDQETALQNIANQQFKQKDRAGAIATLEEARTQARKADPNDVRWRGLSGVAHDMIRMGEIEGGKRCMEDLPAGERYLVQERLAIALREAGKDQEADEMFQAALKDIKTALSQPSTDQGSRLDPAQQRARLVYHQAKIEAESGQLDQARQTASGIRQPEQIRAIACASVARIMAAQGNAEGAIAWINGLELPPHNTTPMQQILEGMAEYAERQEKSKTR